MLLIGSGLRHPSGRREYGARHSRVLLWAHAETDGTLFERLDEGDELAGAPAQPVDVEDDEDTAPAEVVPRQGDGRSR